MEVFFYIINLIIKILGLFIFIFLGVMFGTKERRIYTRNIRVLKKQSWFNKIVNKPSFIMVNNDLFRNVIVKTDIESLLNNPSKIEDFKEELLQIKNNTINKNSHRI